MAEAKANMSEVVNCNKNTIIIVVTIVVLAVVFMYFHDKKQQRAYELRRLEKRVELLEERGRPQQNMQSNTPPVGSGNQGGCFSF